MYKTCVNKNMLMFNTTNNKKKNKEKKKNLPVKAMCFDLYFNISVMSYLYSIKNHNDLQKHYQTDKLQTKNI